eukprot:2013475-Amphidinium_carterae.1
MTQGGFHWRHNTVNRRVRPVHWRALFAGMPHAVARQEGRAGSSWPGCRVPVSRRLSILLYLLETFGVPCRSLPKD